MASKTGLLALIAQLPTGASGFGEWIFIFPRANPNHGRPHVVLRVRIEANGTVLLHLGRTGVGQTWLGSALASGKD
jgi:hypothetical protein